MNNASATTQTPSTIVRTVGAPVVLDLVGATGTIVWIDGDRMGVRWNRSGKTFPALTCDRTILAA